MIQLVYIGIEFLCVLLLELPLFQYIKLREIENGHWKKKEGIERNLRKNGMWVDGLGNESWTIPNKTLPIRLTVVIYRAIVPHTTTLPLRFMVKD